MVSEAAQHEASAAASACQLFQHISRRTRVEARPCHGRRRHMGQTVQIRLHRGIAVLDLGARKGSSGHSSDTDGLPSRSFASSKSVSTARPSLSEISTRDGPIPGTRWRPCAAPHPWRFPAAVAGRAPAGQGPFCRWWANVFSPTQSSMTHHPSSFADRGRCQVHGENASGFLPGDTRRRVARVDDECQTRSSERKPKRW